ncbi:hypothetical protein GCM10023063_14500 [Arthrobacter methylotrophus]|uniref:Major facilitator superfamily (MFS) profile domain-containing protein n=1 Tax=Arthrobacter methylotrophus TaxID=121291 RepID=A0ABV5UTL5_9MICC
MSSTTGSEGRHLRDDRGQAGIPDAVEPRDEQVGEVRRNEPGYVDDTSYVDETSNYGVAPAAYDPRAATRETVIAREKEQFGGIKIGSAFFGWLTATGMAVLLIAILAAAGVAVGVAVGLANNTNVNDAVNQAGSKTAGIAGVIALLVILFLSYYSGGYVAARMARFNGVRQGFMVWLWAIIAAVLVALLGLIAGQRFNILANLNSFPRIPVNEGQLSTTGIIAALIVAAVTLIAAVLGGLAGMHYHRKVDRAGFTPAEESGED